MLTKLRATREIGVVYLLRSGNAEPLRPFLSFIKSYNQFTAGFEHTLYVVCKGFIGRNDISIIHDILKDIRHELLFVDDELLDLGAYYAAMQLCNPEIVLFLNTNSRILGDMWLEKYLTNLDRDGIGVVGSSGSFESASHGGLDNIPFPNPHLRTNAFMLSRELFLKIRPEGALTDKLSTYLFEHHRASLTRRVVSEGYDVLVVGRNGRGYAVNEWASSGTFRSHNQSNLLIGDNRTKQFYDAAPPEKRRLFQLAWGGASVGRVELKQVEDVSTLDFINMSYHIIIGRAPTMQERSEAQQLIDQFETNGRIKLVNKLSKSELLCL